MLASTGPRLLAGSILTVFLAACATPAPEIPTPTSALQPTAPQPTGVPPKPLPTSTGPASATALPCSVEAPWSVELVISGGFAGIEQKLEVESSGAHEAEDLQSGAKVEGTLSAETTAQVEQGLSGICQAQAPGRPPACADCFQYSIEVSVGGVTYQAVYNDLSLPESSVAPLVETLTVILNEALGP